MLRGKSLRPQRRGSNLWPTSAQVKATWAFDVSLAIQISILIKPYQAPISPIPCKLQFNYSVINPETGYPTTTITTFQTINM
jgi:hypothetical protein